MQQQDRPSNVGADAVWFKCKYCPAIVPDDWYHRWKHLQDAHGELSKGIRTMLTESDEAVKSHDRLAREGMIGHAAGYADGAAIGFRSGVGDEIDAAATEFLQSNR